MAPHTGSATPEQVDALLNFLDEHKDLARGQLRSCEGRLRSKRLWGELCDMLNSMGGCSKSTLQWQKVWADRKFLAKRAAADSRRSASATGGGPSTAPPLSQWDLKILSIMGEGFGQRQTTAVVHAFSETSEPMPSTSSQTSQPTLPQPQSLNLPDFAGLNTQPSEEERHPSQLSEPMSVQESFSSRNSARRRRAQSESGVRSRLYDFEERRAERELIRNTELTRIRVILGEVCGLFREFMHRPN